MENLDKNKTGSSLDTPPEKPDKEIQVLWREALRAMSLGWDLAIPIFAGVLLGYVLDRWLGTGHIFTLGLLMLGVITAYYNLARVIQRLRKADRARDKERDRKNEKLE